MQLIRLSLIDYLFCMIRFFYHIYQIVLITHSFPVLCYIRMFGGSINNAIPAKFEITLNTNFVYLFNFTMSGK